MNGQTDQNTDRYINIQTYMTAEGNTDRYIIRQTKPKDISTAKKDDQRQTNQNTDRYINRQTGRQMDRPTKIPTDISTYRQMDTPT